MIAIEIVCLVLSCIPIVCALFCIVCMIGVAINLRRNDKAMGAYLDAKFKAENPEIYGAFFGGGGVRVQVEDLGEKIVINFILLSKGAKDNVVKPLLPTNEVEDDSRGDAFICERRESREADGSENRGVPADRDGAL